MVVRPLARLLAPTSLAFVGGAAARTAIEQCLALGFEGDLWPVHPTRGEVCGLPAYRSVDELPGAPDAALVAVNREATIDVVGRLAARGSGAAVCYASGFAEVGAEGARLQAELVAAAGDMPVVGPNCYGTVSAVAGAALWPDQQGLGRADRGIALVTQSGNIGLNLTMQTRPMSIAHLLTLGNQAGVGIEDCLEALVADPAVTGIGLHIEALHDVERFSAACAVAAARAVPVVALKTGTSDAGARIAASHTGSMVGSDVAYSALFGRLGVHRVDSIPGLLDALHVLTSLGPLSEFVSVANPLDYHTFIWGDEEALGNCFTAVLDGAFDASLLVLDFPSVGLDDATWWPTLRAFGAARAASGTPALLVGSMAENLPAAAEQAAVDLGLIPVRGIDAALAGIEAAVRWGRHEPRGAPSPATALPGAPEVLHEVASKRLLGDAGLPVPPGEEVPASEADAVAARIGFPVVVKATGLVHKSESGGVVLDLADGPAVAAAAGELGGTVLVEAQVVDAVAELLLDVRREPPVGWLLTLGVGGTLVEVLRETRSLVLPVDADDVRRALEDLAVAPLLAGHRGRPAADVDAIIGVVERLQDLVLSRPDLVEVEVNPLLACPDGAVVADALVTVAGVEEGA